MGRRLSWLLVGPLALTGTALLGPPAQAAANDLFHPFTTTMPGSSPAAVAIGDVTGDGRPDVVMTTDYYFDPDHDFSLFVYAQQDDGSLGAPTQVRTGAKYGSGMGIALADLDGDGDLDAAVSTTDGVQVYRQEAGALSYSWTVPAGDAQDIRLADLNADGLADLVTNSRTGVQVWWQVAGDFSRGPVLGGSSHVEVDTGDVTGDGLVDVVAATNSGVEVYAQQAGNTFAAAVAYDSGTGDPSVNGLAVGDTNGDGRADVHLSVGGNAPNAWVVTRSQLSDGTLAKPYVLSSLDIPEAIEAADVTGDGRKDLVVVHSGFDRLGVYDSTPGTMTTEALYAYDANNWGAPQRMAVGDVNGDGLPDVVGADDLDGLVVMLHALPGDDITAPNTTITSAPPYTLRSRTATFAFSADEASTFSCSMDAAPWTACTSPTTYDGLAQGNHRFQVRATDLAGNVDASAAASSFTVEGPDTSITAGTEGTVRSTSAWFAFASQPAAASYECSMDGAPWVACTSQQSWTGLATGASHTFKVRGVSADGLVDSTPATRTWTIEAASDLAVTLSAGPSTVKRNGTVTWTATVRNLGPQSASTATFTQGLPSGTTFASVKAVPSSTSTASTADCAGSGSPATVRCTFGTVAPGLTWTVTVTGTVTVSKGSLASTAVASTSTWDLSPDNDSASATVTVSNGNGR